METVKDSILYLYVLTRFLHANRLPSLGLKPEDMLRSKTLWTSVMTSAVPAPIILRAGEIRVPLALGGQAPYPRYALFN